MTMGDELPVTSLVLPVLIRPVLTQVCMSLISAFQHRFKEVFITNHLITSSIRFKVTDNVLSNFYFVI